MAEGAVGVCRLGLVDYRQAWNLQQKLTEARRNNRIPDILLLLEHPHTFTLGRRGRQENILLPPEDLDRREITVHEVDRGGDVTYHGPGQLVGYPILKLQATRLDYVRYIRDLEQVMLLSVRDLAGCGELMDRYSGVWVRQEKVCAIGVKVDAFGVTSHGFALNVNTDLSYFSHIVPCGIPDKGVTSLRHLSGQRVSMRRASDVVMRHFAEVFKREPQRITRKFISAFL